MTDHADMTAFARQIFDAQPFSRWIGAELVSVGADDARIALDLCDRHRQQHGFVHGGVISYLADNAITFAGGLALGGNALTSEFKINYLRPGVGERLVAEAQTLSAGKRQAVCSAHIFAETGAERRLCAVAQGTVLPVAG
ncbi:thioesterase [Rhodothalassium salexigens]|uniref:PaaI family thioesterase n=1 Tax=Rhodothalassium salexigens TaxID=1086 RepID=UPI0019137EA5|nr:PaaI family thioesterase [Rhodothalassium salexigens]MBK5910262.1 thioesterase [Rhodothalassium salexigens]MBK5921377.1 thioesterase [Rhodothalassium salexigens]